MNNHASFIEKIIFFLKIKEFEAAVIVSLKNMEKRKVELNLVFIYTG
jgi:hypothetical protein